MIDGPQAALRFLHYAGLLGLFGWTAFRVVGLRSLPSLPRDHGRAAVLAAALAVPILTVALMLASIAAMMGQPLVALDWPVLEAMISSTSMGWAFLVRVALLVTALGVLIASRGTAALAMAAGCYAGALVTLGWSGHAAATEGALGLFHRLNNGAHLLASGLWLGAIGWFVHLTIEAHRQRSLSTVQSLFAVTHGFFPLGVTLVAVVAVTGLINAQLILNLQNGIGVLTTGYGLLLAAKVALVAGMLAFGAHNAHIGRRAAAALAPDDPGNATALRLLRYRLAKEFGLGVGVVALVAVLGMLSPMVME